MEPVSNNPNPKPFQAQKHSPAISEETVPEHKEHFESSEQDGLSALISGVKELAQKAGEGLSQALPHTGCGGGSVPKPKPGPGCGGGNPKPKPGC